MEVKNRIRKRSQKEEKKKQNAAVFTYCCLMVHSFLFSLFDLFSVLLVQDCRDQKQPRTDVNRTLVVVMTCLTPTCFYFKKKQECKKGVSKRFNKACVSPFTQVSYSVVVFSLYLRHSQSPRCESNLSLCAVSPYSATSSM